MKLKDKPDIRRYLQSVVGAGVYLMEIVSNGKDAVSNCRP